ncbi:molecular chaperone TorD [Citrobacter sp. Cm038]|uniref:molecular chaperone TorD n=1 Tax=Citrobacter sp. Cm038 TaxID=2985117 RepID=UPI0025752E97|nr:molecular chaperone TorD [Citrobacter sp. Cm038]MDM2944990.1 molecular chaperone TorD [Citrobacter sp. Cm038]
MDSQKHLTEEQIACVYAWLARLFSRELDSESLLQLHASDMQDWYSLLKREPSLNQPVTILEEKIAALKLREEGQLELAADFCGLFLMSDTQAALPYASIYEQCESGDSEIKHLLFEAGMQTSETFNEPGDHLAIFLELLSHLHFSLGEENLNHLRINALRRKTVSVLLRLLPEFSANCCKYDAFGFYAALSQLGLALVQLDNR